MASRSAGLVTTTTAVARPAEISAIVRSELRPLRAAVAIRGEPDEAKSFASDSSVSARPSTLAATTMS